MKRIGKARVLVIDDWGFAPMAAAERRDLFEVIEDRHGIASTIVATQLPVKTSFYYCTSQVDSITFTPLAAPAQPPKRSATKPVR